MARIGSLTSEALSRRKDHLSPGLTSLLRASSSAAPNRADMLLGISSSGANPSLSSPSKSLISTKALPAVLDEEDLIEFKEEDVWAAETGGIWPEVRKEAREIESNRQEARNVYSAHGSIAIAHGSDTKGCLHTAGVITNSRRRLGLDAELGLTAAFADAGPGFSLSSLSPVSWSQSPSREGTPGRLSTASRRIIPPQLIGHADYFDARKQVQHHQSAPVNVPDWSKILGSGKHKDGHGFFDDVDEDEDEERLPPHELLARESARSQVTTFSVREGIGRTLKGRDLSRVRNAVLRQTGFID